MEDPTEEADLRPPGAAEEPATEPGPVRGGAWSSTGEPRVDAALARLDELEGLPVTEHHAVFEDVHGRLSEVLGELAAGQPPAAGQAQAEAQPRPGGPGR